MNVHELTLQNYSAASGCPSACQPTLYLGTAGSYGNEQINVVLGEGWQGLTVKAVFQPSGVPVVVPDGGGVISVPWEATQSVIAYPKGRISFQGYSSGRLVNTSDVPYTVGGSSAGSDNTPAPTPDEFQQFVDAVKSDADRAAQAAADAEAAVQDTKDAGAQAVTDIGNAKDSALEAIDAAREEAAGSISADVEGAKQAAADAEQSAADAEQSAKDAAGALANVQAAGKSALDDIATERQNALSDIQNEGAKQQSAVAGAGTAALEAIGQTEQAAINQVKQAGETQAAAVQSAGTTQVGLINSAGAAQVQAVKDEGAAQTAALNDAAEARKNELESIASHPPQPNTATGKWQTWNAETGAYQDTDALYQGGYYTPAVSDDGVLTWQGSQEGMPELPSVNIKGPKGDKGDPGLGVPSPTQSDAGKVPTVKADGSAYELAGPYAPLSAVAAELDAIFGAMLDGKNTTRLFWLWWPASDDGAATKYARLERWAKLLAAGWQDKTYTLRFYNAQTSGDYNGTPMDDLADGREAAPLVTDASEPVDDWTENDPMTWYIRGNALSLADGTMNILALEGEDGFDVTGETAPVYCFAVSTCMKEWEDESYLYHSWRTQVGDGYIPMAGDVAPDNNWRQLTWRTAFHGGKNSAGGLTSGAGLPPIPWTSVSAALPLARQTSAYEGLWTDCDQQWVLSQWQLRHWTLSNSGKLEGCTSYNYQYTLAVAETGVKRVLVTTAQGANFLSGSGVCLGERGANSNNDRNQSYNHDVFNWAKIVSIEEVTVEDVQYTALNLDLPEPIDTTTTMLVSTMVWPSGTTEVLQGHSDGCIGSLTDGKYPYRVAGVEMQNGAYIEVADPLWPMSIVDEKRRYDVYSVRDATKQAASRTSDYELTDSFDLPDDTEYKWNYITELGELTAEAMIPKAFNGGSSSTYYRAAFLSSGGAGGLRCPWRGGTLYDVGLCGLPCTHGAASPGSSLWYGAPRLAGSGKTRGEWPAD